MIFFMVLWLFMWRWWYEWPKALTPLSSAVKNYKSMNKLGIRLFLKNEYCSYFIGNSCLFLVNECSYLIFLSLILLWFFKIMDQISVIAVKDFWSQLKIFFMFSRLELMHFWHCFIKARLIDNQQFLSAQIRELNFCWDCFPPQNAFGNEISMSIIYLLTKSPNEMQGTPKDISKLISSVSLSPDQGSNYFAAQMISAYIFYASEPGSHRYMSSIITLKLQQPWLLSMMLVSSSLMFRQYRIDFSFGFNFFCTITIVQRCPFSKVDFKKCILSIPCSWLEAFQPLCSGHSYMSLNLDHGNLS